MVELIINGQTIQMSADYWHFLEGLAGILFGAVFMFSFYKALISG